MLFVPTPDDADYVVGKKALPILQGSNSNENTCKVLFHL
jgi:hypothetical protein